MCQSWIWWRLRAGGRGGDDRGQSETADASDEKSEDDESGSHEPEGVQVNGAVAVVHTTGLIVIRRIDTVHQDTAGDEPAEQKAIDERLVLSVTRLYVCFQF